MEMTGKPKRDVFCVLCGGVFFFLLPGMDHVLAISPARALRYCFMFSSFSSSMSFRDAFTLFDTSFPCEKSLWRSLNVIVSGAPPSVFSWSGPLQSNTIIWWAMQAERNHSPVIITRPQVEGWNTNFIHFPI